jgi:Protein of unknown function (DUF2786)
MPDWPNIIRALRAQAADPGIGEAERAAFTEKADKLEAKYGNSSSPSTDDTTVTGRDGRWVRQPAGFRPTADQEYWDEYMRNIVKNQYQWNTKYYDKDGNPKPGYGGPDVDDLYEDEFKYDGKEDDYDAE